MYWVRRGLLLAGVVLVVWVLARCNAQEPSVRAAPGPDFVRAAAGPSRSAAAAATGAAVSTTPPTAFPRASRGSSRAFRVRPVLSPPVGRCDPATTLVRPDAPDPVVAGTGALLQLRVAVSGDRACTLVLGEQLLAQVSRDGEPRWRLSDCPSALSEDSVVLRPGWATVVDIAWSGRTSNATCSVETTALRAGTYQLQAAMLGGEPGAVDLEVVRAEDTVTPESGSPRLR